MTGIVRQHLTDVLASLNEIEARKAELASRTICDGCQGPLTLPGAISGIHVVCPECLKIWHTTGRKPEVTNA